LAEATKVFGEVRAGRRAQASARQAMCSAEVALFTATACFAPQAAASAASKRGISGPWVRKSERSTALTAAMSASVTSCRP
jgi:hypothetical protein